MWKVQKQLRRGPWKTLYEGPEASARCKYRDAFARRRPGGLVLLDGVGLPVLWSPRPPAFAGGGS